MAILQQIGVSTAARAGRTADAVAQADRPDPGLSERCSVPVRLVASRSPPPAGSPGRRAPVVPLTPTEEHNSAERASGRTTGGPAPAPRSARRAKDQEDSSVSS